MSPSGPAAANRSARPGGRFGWLLGKLRRRAGHDDPPGPQVARFVSGQQMDSLGRVTGGVAHDFNNLLTVVLGNAAALRVGADARGDQQAARRAELIERAAERGSRLAAQLLAFSGKQVLLPRVLSAYDVVSGAHHLLAGAAGEAIQIALTSERNLWPCRVDPGQLESAILNLVLNARDAMAEGGSVVIHFRNRIIQADPGNTPWRVPGDYISIDVRDQGTGIPPELQERVFEPFFTTKPIGQGSGLGLAQVHGFTRQSGGWVELTSVVGSGTTVSLFLPRFRRLDRNAPDAAGTAPTGQKTILVVEPDADLRKQSCEALAAAGYAALEATTGSSAITHLVSEAPIRLLVTAEKLTGGISGADLGRHAGTLRPKLPVLVCSHQPSDAPPESLQVPASGKQRFAFLMKPFGPGDFVAVVAAALTGETFSVETENLLAEARDTEPSSPVIHAPDSVADAPIRSSVRSNTIRLGVVPFRALGADNQAVCVGLAEEITNAIAAFRMIECVAPASLAVVARAPQDQGDLWQDLDLDFRVEGSLRRRNGELQVFVRLVRMGDSAEIAWSRRFDGQASEALSIQDSIAREIAAQVAPQVMVWGGRDAAQRPRVNATAQDLMLRAIPAVYSLDPAGFAEAGALLRQSVEMDSANAASHAWLAHWHLFGVGQGWSDEPRRAIEEAERLARKAIALDPRDARGFTVAGHVLAFLRRNAEGGLALHEKALALNPSLAQAWCYAGLAQCYLGNHAEAIRAIRHARRLSPHDPHGFFFDTALILPLFLQGEYRLVAEIGRRAAEAHPGVSSTYKVLLAALGMLGATAEATKTRRRLLQLEPGFCVTDAVSRSPLLRPEDLNRYSDGLRRAGLPEWSDDSLTIML